MNFLLLVMIPISTYPRKGTETEVAYAMEDGSTHFNLSPQGDGNLMVPMLELGVHNTFQLIPARGRKPFCL